MSVPANPAIDLTTIADATAWLGAMNITAPQADQIQQIITAMSSSIQAWLGRNLISASYMQTFDGRGSDRLALPNSPITAVSSVIVDALTIPASQTTTDFGYIFSTIPEPPANPWLFLRGYRFCKGIQNVLVSYTAGYSADSLPPAIVQAVREAITALTQVAAREPGLIEEKVGGLEERYASPVPTSNSSLDQFILTPTVTLALQPFRRVVPFG